MDAMFVGIDHSTTGVKSCLLDEDGVQETFVIERSPDEDCDWSYVDTLSEYVTLDEVEMIAYGYSYGDGFSRVKDITDVENRGIEDKLGLGHDFGTGTLVFDQLQDSSLPCVVFPGVHSGLESIYPYFTYHSPMTGADKVAMTRYAQEVVDGDASVISACVSSSEMATYVDEGQLRGAFTWMGLIHGWPGIDELRDVRDGEKDLQDLIMRSGILYRSGEDFESVKGVPDKQYLERIYESTLHNVYTMLAFARHRGSGVDRIVLSGRLSGIREPIDMRTRLEDALSEHAPVHFCQDYSTALGAAYIARDVARGATDVIGIPVAESARRSPSMAVA